MRMQSARLRWFFVVACISVITSITGGCGDGRPERAPISGQVLIDGKPLTCGTICIIPENARMAAGDIGPDGRFTMRCFDENDGAVLGTHPVTVTAFEQIDNATRKWFAPKKYSDAKTSGKTVTVDGANDSLVINLTWEGGKPFVERFANGHWQ